MKIEIKCSFCGNSFLKEKKEITRQHKNGNFNFYCSKKCINNGTLKKRTKHISIVRKCIFCGKEFESTTHKKYKKCCTRHCASLYSKRYVNSETISKSMKIAHKEGRAYKNSIFPKMEARECVICGKTFEYARVKKRKTCNNVCHRKLISNLTRLNPNCGGETNYRRYKYKGIMMDSSWEVQIAKWMDAHNILWYRDRKYVFKWKDSSGKIRRYYPDFFLPEKNVYVDTKNKFLMKRDADKLNRVRIQCGITLYAGAVDDIIVLIRNFGEVAE